MVLHTGKGQINAAGPEIWRFPRVGIRERVGLRYDQSTRSPDGRFFFAWKADNSGGGLFSAVDFSESRSNQKPDVMAWSPDSHFLALSQGDSVQHLRRAHGPDSRVCFGKQSASILVFLSGQHAIGLRYRLRSNCLFRHRNRVGQDATPVRRTSRPDRILARRQGADHDRQLRLVRRWDLTAGKLLVEHHAHPTDSREIHPSPAGSLVAVAMDRGVVHLCADDGSPGLTYLALEDDLVYISPDGHYHTDLVVLETNLLYVVQTDDGSQQIHTPSEFAAKYSWKNHPEKVRARAKLQVRERPRLVGYRHSCLTGLAQLPRALCVTLRRFFRPEGAQQISPGQRPGWGNRGPAGSPKQGESSAASTRWFCHPSAPACSAVKVPRDVCRGLPRYAPSGQGKRLPVSQKAGRGPIRSVSAESMTGRLASG